MKVEPWRKWMGEMGEEGVPSFEQAYPDKAAAILSAIEFGIRVEFNGDRNKPVHGINRPVASMEIEEKVSAVIQADVDSLKKKLVHLVSHLIQICSFHLLVLFQRRIQLKYV
jgi:hypothetical protein